MFKAAFVSALSTFLLSSFSPAAMDCSALLGKDPNTVLIPDILQVTNTSKIQYNGKLTMAYLYQMIETQYGPLTAKPVLTGLNWDAMKIQGLKDVANYKTTLDQYYAMADFLYKFNDAHVSIEIPSTLKARLPLQITSHEDKLLVGFVGDSYPTNVRQLGIADEIIAINGMSPSEFQKQFPTFNAAGNDVTNRTMFGLRLSSLSESSGLPLSKLQWKDINFTVRSFKDKNDIYDVRIPFQWEGLGLIAKSYDVNDPSPAPVFALSKKLEDPNQKLAPKTLSIVDKAHNLLRAEATSIVREIGSKPRELEKGMGQRVEIGARKPFFKLPENFVEMKLPMAMKVPPLNAFVSLEGFLAGTFQRGGKTVGFLRIPSYTPDSILNMATTLRYIMGRLQKETDYLVIDQTNNPGGMVILSDLIIKSLTGQYDKNKHMRFAVKPSDKFLRQYAEMITEIAKNEDKLFTDAEVKEIVTELAGEFNKIRKAQVEQKSLCEPVSMLAISVYAERSFDKALFKIPFIGGLLKRVSGIDLREHQTYTKPVYFAINELDFSGGDATPAGLADYGRVTLVGTRHNTKTAGAGGTVEKFSIRAAIDAMIHLTTSLMTRATGRPVENVAVEADINVPVIQADVANNFATYFERFMQRIEQHRATGR